MEYLLDTAAFITIHENPHKLSASLYQNLQDPTNEIYMSVISFWEILIKHQLGRLDLSSCPEKDIPKQCQHSNIELLPLNVPTIQTLATLPAIHKDPFDRMIICQAKTANLPIISPDKILKKYGVEVLW